MSNTNDPTPPLPVYKPTGSMHKCILKNDLESLKHMLSDGRRDCLNDLDYSGRTPFHVALQTANPRALYLMLYYPLLHPSKMFATREWISYLESACRGDPSSARGASDGGAASSPGVSDFLNGTKPNEPPDSPSKAADSTKPKAPDTSALMEMLLSTWEDNPTEYLNAVLSLEDRNAVCGCGTREVEALYDEHYKFLVGETHDLEEAAKQYTNKYVKMYSGSLLRKVSKPAPPLRPEMSGVLPPPGVFKPAEPHEAQEPGPFDDLKGILDGAKLNARPLLTRIYSGDKITQNTPPEKPPEPAPKGAAALLPLEKVDTIATFDKTAPLHLLFSNVYISSYRPNMAKCFRILIYYFDKCDEFQSIYKSLEYRIHSNALSVNTCLEMYWSTKYQQSPRKKVAVKQDSRRAGEGPDSRGSLRSPVVIDSDDRAAARELEDEETTPKRLRTRSPNKPGRPTQSAGPKQNFPNPTVCADAVEMAQKRDKRSHSLLNAQTTQASDDPDCEDSLFEERDGRGLALHNMMTRSAWTRPHVSWDTFVKSPDFSRSTVLHRVCNLRDQNVVKLVLSCGFSPVVVNEAGDMPVHLAADAKDPYSFLTVLHATLKALFYAHYNPHAKFTAAELVWDADSPAPTDGSFDRAVTRLDRASRTFLNEFFNMYMAQMCKDFFKCRERQPERYFRTIDADKFEAMLAELGAETRQTLVDEFLMLYEQLVYRCIRRSSWDCLMALLAYNACLSYHVLSNPCFMHRFINLASMTNNAAHFVNVTEFVVTNVLFEAPDTRQARGIFATLMSKVEGGAAPGRTKGNPLSRSASAKRDSFRGCGVPHAGLRTFSLSSGRGPAGKYDKPCFDEDPVLARFIRSYKVSTRLQDRGPKTWVVTHPTCLHHLATPEPTDAPNKRHRLIVTYPENPTRLEVIISNDNGILRSDTLENVKLVHSPPSAALADVLRVHDCAYIDRLLEQVQVAQKRWASHPYWPVLADGDTPVTPHSWSAALYAAGSGRRGPRAVLTAVDAVCTGQCKNAFCAVRPPGHHLGTWGAAQSNNFEDEDFAAGSQGFCLINNVAIGAAYAKYTYAARGIRRIAIVDFDVHHGNGTEQVVRNIGTKTIRQRINLGDPMGQDAFGPQPVTVVSPSHAQHKKWFGWRDENDAEEVLFCSIHAYDGVFYPGTGEQCTMYQREKRPNVINVAVPQGTSSAEFRALFETKICPYVYHFRPDLIFISAGFDGHYRDSVSYGFTRYTEQDFNYVTERLVTVANAVCEGRVVSVLEGGYNTRLNTLSPFARSVLEHVTALCATARSTEYPLMFGEGSLAHLFAPVLRTLAGNAARMHRLDAHDPARASASDDDSDGAAAAAGPSCSPPPAPAQVVMPHLESLSLSNRKANNDLVFKVYRLRTKTDLMVSKAYTKAHSYCRLDRLARLDRTHTCVRTVFEACGNAFLALYSRYFYTLFGVAGGLKRAAFSFAVENPLPAVDSSSLKAERDEKAAEFRACVEKLSDMAKQKTGRSPQRSPLRSPAARPARTHSPLSVALDEATPSPKPVTSSRLTSLVHAPSNPTLSNLTDFRSDSTVALRDAWSAVLKESDYAATETPRGGLGPRTPRDPEKPTPHPFSAHTGPVTPLPPVPVMEPMATPERSPHRFPDSLPLPVPVPTLESDPGEPVASAAAAPGGGAEPLLTPRRRNPFEHAEDYCELVDDFVLRVKAVRDMNDAHALLSAPWLASVLVRALEQNLKVATDLVAFYDKFAQLFEHACHIHRA